MHKENSKYERVRDLLRKSKPVLNEIEAEALSERVLKQIREKKSNNSMPDLVMEFLFGWVYIGCVRKSMIAAAFAIIILFGYQQVIILKRINELSNRKVNNETLLLSFPQEDLNTYLMLRGIYAREFADKKITISERDIDKMIKSVTKLRVKYKDLFELIEKDPQLRKYVETRMKENLKQ